MDSGNAQPQPSFELPNNPGQIENTPGSAPEHAPSPELPNPSSPPKTPIITSNPIVVAQPSLPVVDSELIKQPETQIRSGGLPAEDADLIEKHWVEKAKKIVEQTRDDPYVQSQKISEVKAEYKSQRFKIDTKLPEETS